MINKDLLYNIIEIGGAIGTILALGLAMLTESKVRRVYKSAKEISESISTKYVGYFPDNMDEIIKLISSTKRRLVIISDVPAYGHFSSPQNFARYEDAIRNLLIPSIKPVITLITYGSEKRLLNSKNQFKNRSYEELKNGDAYKNYFEYHKLNKNVKHPIINEEDKEEIKKKIFSEWLNSNHTRFLDSLDSMGVNVFESFDDIRAFVWIIDESAIFSFYNYGINPREVSFKTNDQTLINILLEIADATKSNSVEFNKKQK